MGAIAGQAPRTSHNSPNPADNRQIGSIVKRRPVVHDDNDFGNRYPDCFRLRGKVCGSELGMFRSIGMAARFLLGRELHDFHASAIWVIGIETVFAVAAYFRTVECS